MYEKIVNYFETNLCIENIYFRKNYKSWIIGIISVLILEITINYLISALINNIWTRTISILIINIIITIVFFILIYALPIVKIYRHKVKTKVKMDLIGVFMKEEVLSAYREVEITEMEMFLKKECKIKNVESINMIINLINEDIKDKYEKKSFMDKYFNNIILPIAILILTVYFTNNNHQRLLEIILTTIMWMLIFIFVGNIIFKMRNITIIPVNKRENLLELKRVLIDIQIKWNK